MFKNLEASSIYENRHLLTWDALSLHLIITRHILVLLPFSPITASRPFGANNSYALRREGAYPSPHPFAFGAKFVIKWNQKKLERKGGERCILVTNMYN